VKVRIKIDVNVGDLTLLELIDCIKSALGYTTIRVKMKIHNSHAG
jgi:hypothetical protein